MSKSLQIEIQKESKKSKMNRKRRFIEIENETECDKMNKIKKRKIAENDKIYSKLFENEHDQKGFLKIFKSIESTELINKLSIPSCINQEISEYATGYIEQCGNSKCNNKVIVLMSDWNDFEPEHESYIYDPEIAIFYCSLCMIFVEFCTKCESYSFSPKQPKCSICSISIWNCHGSCYCHKDRTFSIDCYECDKLLCQDCDKFCNICHKVLCGKCFDETKSGQYVAFQCDQCLNSIPINHETCDSTQAIQNYWNDTESQDYDFDYCSYRDCIDLVCIKCGYSKWNENVSEKEFFCKKHIPGKETDISGFYMFSI